MKNDGRSVRRRRKIFRAGLADHVANISADFDGDCVILDALPDQIAIINYDGMSIRKPHQVRTSEIERGLSMRMQLASALARRWPV